MPDVLTQGLVLGLTLEAELVNWHLVRICQTCVHHSCHSSELSLVVFLRLTNRVILEVAFACRRTAATAVAPVAGDSDEFLFLSENLA